MVLDATMEIIRDQLGDLKYVMDSAYIVAYNHLGFDCSSQSNMIDPKLGFKYLYRNHSLTKKIN